MKLVPTDTYTPPASRSEAVEEIMRSGFTISAMLAVAIAFPLPGEIEETLAANKRMEGGLDYYFAESCFYLDAWGRNSCPVVHAGESPATVSV